MSAPVISSGSCFCYFAYDIALGADLDQAAKLCRDTQREELSRARRTPSSFQYRPTPVRIIQTAESGVTIGAFSTSPRIELTLFDFGAISVAYQIPLAGPLDALLPLSDALYENASLLEDSRKRVADLLWTIRDALDKPHIADFVEDYAVFQIEGLEGRDDFAPDHLLSTHKELIARILRSETAPLSQGEIQDALGARISYSPNEAAIIDWNASILFFQPDPDDIRAVLEYTNVELLEMRHLDDQLDDVLDRSREGLARLDRWWRAILPADRAVRRVAELQMDSALLFEGVNNALKLVGDQYLARLYKLAAQRLHLPEWDASILRKLETAESIYQKLSDRQATRRMEVLEWIIIILIAISTIPALWAMF
jgi:hypothetical protein